MKREILFRGKRVDKDTWVERDLIHGVNHKRGKIFILPIRGGVSSLDGGIDPIDGWEVIPETVGQFTGRTDKHGTNIFKGDMVIERLPDACEPQGYYDCKSVVEFIQGCWVLSQVGFDYSNTPLYERSFLFEANDIELIGNIHDKEVTNG